ncbi:hypothetical protein PHLCEN_2v10245 [Hermanssonia centrifuga]|uniref:HTH CENPB-type domain-containing protein n=1 Tax=Hermanssonia centrifuga TaxID=98765 RepID=A0A2R6NPD0_9APHY|nr:hypothetical protein PHLCEN_2v10245 [Hermanssonia centrifuga]
MSKSHLDVDLDSLPKEEHIDCALAAVHAEGFKTNGQLNYSLHAAASDFKIPCSTLTARYNGTKTRKEAHKHEQKLSAEAEEVLVTWIKVMGRRGVPFTSSIICEYASHIAGTPVGESWIQRFKSRHTDLKVRWTSSLEACRARVLNSTLVKEYFDIIHELITKYYIPPENIYNMDEKGLLLGVGKHVRAFVDPDQKTLYQTVLQYDRLLFIKELAKILNGEGTILVGQAKFPLLSSELLIIQLNHSISHSPKGWTDQELGCLWLKNDFEPQSAARNLTDGYCLLILDGHCSHLTFRFCHFAELHRILIVCLPLHTTHALQPCNVGVFGPLQSYWKSKLNAASRGVLE